MNFLHERSTEQEWMDDLNCHGEVVDQTLRELETINRLLGGDHVTLDGIEHLLRDRDITLSYTIADLGCGGGDLAMKILRWGKRKNLNLLVLAVDANPHIINFAEKNCLGAVGINFEKCNVFSAEFQEKKFDIMVATLFIHHFTKDQLIGLFRKMKELARIGIVVNDIHRHFLSYHSIRLLTRLFSRSEMVKFDAPLSVRRAFRRKELVEILERAGIVNYSLRWKWAFRWQLIITC